MVRSKWGPLQRGSRVIHTELRSGANADGPSIERDIRTYLAATYLRPLRDAEAELNATRGSRLSQILMSAAKFRDQAHIEDLLIAVITANQQILVNEGISESRKKISERLEQLNFSTDACRPIIEILGGTDASKLTEPEKRQLFRGILEKLQLLIDENDRHQGLGYNNLLFMATELLLLEQDGDEFPLLIIEEPEAHLHPQLQMKFLKAIREDFGGDGKPMLQSILSSHSPNLASKAPLPNVTIMAKGNAYSLDPGVTQLDPSDYIFLEKFLDVTKSNLFFCKGVLIVEGDAEAILLPTIAELLGVPLEHYGISIVNVGSTAFARYAKIFKRKDLDDIQHSEKWLPIKAVCLRDLDLWPARAEKQSASDPIGLKPKLQPDEKGHGGNLAYWESSYDENGLKAYVKRKKEVEGQNVRVEVSDVWTFEYSLIKTGLAKEIYLAAGGTEAEFDLLSGVEEERALQVFQLAEEAKTETAYRLCRILTEVYSLKPELPAQGESDTDRTARTLRNADAKTAKCSEFRSKVPAYILRAIDYLTRTERVDESVVLAAIEGDNG